MRYYFLRLSDLLLLSVFNIDLSCHFETFDAFEKFTEDSEENCVLQKTLKPMLNRKTKDITIEKELRCNNSQSATNAYFASCNRRADSASCKSPCDSIFADQSNLNL